MRIPISDDDFGTLEFYSDEISESITFKPCRNGEKTGITYSEFKATYKPQFHCMAVRKKHSDRLKELYQNFKFKEPTYTFE